MTDNPSESKSQAPCILGLWRVSAALWGDVPDRPGAQLCVQDDSGKLICSIPPHRQDAARLIAAAPELYAALVALTRVAAKACAGVDFPDSDLQIALEGAAKALSRTTDHSEKRGDQ